jgi:D-inositol-3-phosphate glycosyltransferase
MNVYVHELAAAMARSGVDVEVYTRADDPALPAIVSVEPGLRVHHIAAGPLAPVLKEELVELVPEFVDGVAMRMAERPPDAIHANYWLSGVAGHELKHRFDVPLACTFHTLALVKGEAGTAERPDRARAEASVIGCSDAVFASCPDEAAQLVRLYDTPADRIEVVSPGVDHAYFAPGSRAGARRAIGVDPARPVVLYVGRIQPLKGLDVAVAAFAELQDDAVMVVVGGPSGPDGATYLAGVHAQSNGCAERIRWVAPQPHELLASYYRAADVVLVPSQSESFGLVALEAAACGTPVVATAVGGLHTLVRDGITGYLRPRTAGAFAEAAASILGHPALAARLGAAAAEHGRAFSWRAAAASMTSVFEGLTERVPVACS